jgi:hypothetical protein
MLWVIHLLIYQSHYTFFTLQKCTILVVIYNVATINVAPLKSLEAARSTDVDQSRNRTLVEHQTVP